MSELPNREIKRDEFMKRLIGRLEPGFSEDDLAFLTLDSLTRQCLALEIVRERMFQIAKCGTNPVPIFVGLATLLEEVGEANKAVLENNPKEYRSELVQVAAVCMRLIEELDNLKLRENRFDTRSGEVSAKDEWRTLTEKEKAAIVLDEMTKSDDGKVRESAFRLKNSVDAIEAFGKLDQAESKPTGYLNGKIQTIEKRLENLFNRINHAEARLNICERYESKVEVIEERFNDHERLLALLVQNFAPRGKTLEKTEAQNAEAPGDETAPVTQDANLKDALKAIECFEEAFPRPWTVDRRDLICDAMGLSLHAGVHLKDYIDALRTIAGLK